MQRFRHTIKNWLFLLTVIAGTAPAGGLMFVRENIAVSLLLPDTVMVHGEYFFCSGDTVPASSQLYYPFPIDSSAGFPCYSKVRDERFAKDIPFSSDHEGISFPVTVRAGDTTEIVVVYKQQTGKRTGWYILLTTGAWSRPLVNSRYSVSIPNTMTLAYMSYECDSVVSAGNCIVYHFYKKKFMPDRDLSFSWKGLESKKQTPQSTVSP
jgi:hypothetical protein